MEFKQTKTANLEKAIVEAIAFFDLFDYPLTAFEIWQYCRAEVGLSEVIYALDNKSDSVLLRTVESLEGFYFLKARDNIIKKRKDRYNYTDKKFKRAVMVAKIFKFIPWTKMIAVGNIIGAHNLKKESDIDLFIITERRRIWITRFFCVLITKFLGLRPKPGNERDKICLSFFVSEDAMDLSGLMLGSKKSPDYYSAGQSDRLSAVGDPPRNHNNKIDIYFIYWLAGLALVYNKDGTYKKFMDANNWINICLPNLQYRIQNYSRDAGKSFSKFYHDVVEMLLGGLEKVFKKIQLRLMPDKLKSIINKDTRVVVNDHVLKLHVNDRREKYREKYIKKISGFPFVCR